MQISLSWAPWPCINCSLQSVYCAEYSWLQCYEVKVHPSSCNFTLDRVSLTLLTWRSPVRINRRLFVDPLFSSFHELLSVITTLATQRCSYRSRFEYHKWNEYIHIAVMTFSVLLWYCTDLCICSHVIKYRYTEDCSTYIKMTYMNARNFVAGTL